MPGHFERLPQPDRAPTLDLDRFTEYYPSGTIHELDWDELSKKLHAMEPGEKWLDKSNLESYGVSHGENDVSYIIIGRRSIGRADEIKILDEQNGEIIGRGNVTKWDRADEYGDGNHPYSNYPYASWTTTRQEKQGRGLGTRRFFLMNAVAQAKYHEPLRSDIVQADEEDQKYGPEYIWKKMVERGYATTEQVLVYFENQSRYRMLPDAKPPARKITP